MRISRPLGALGALASGALAFAAVASAARAQTAGPADPRDSLPARAGAYALEGGVGVNSTSLGVLRFLSPRSALGATLTADYQHQSGDRSSYDRGGFTLSLGYRRYGRLRDRVGAFGTAGLTGGYERYTQTQTNAYDQGTFTTRAHNAYASAGAFGELGAAYLVVPRLAVNASALASVVGTFARATNSQDGPGGSGTSSARQHGVRGALGPVRLGLTLFL